MLMTGNLAHAQYANVPVTGFNADIVADGLGSAASASTTFDVDGTGTGYVFVSSTFGPSTSACGSAATSWPAGNQITSTNTTTGTGITYQLQSPGNGATTNNNSLRLVNGASGALTLVTPVAASNLYFVCLGGNGAVAFTATVTFSDATTQTVTPTVSAPDWCGGAATYKLTTQQYYRISRSSTSCNGAGCQYIYEVPGAINSANWGKTITSISFSNNNSAGTTALHVLAVGMKTPCATPATAPTALNFTDSTSSTVTGAFTAGDAINYMVVRYPAGGTVTAPVNGTAYTVGAALGTGTVASVGTTSTFTASNLYPSTGYDFYVYGYNTGATCGGPVFNATASTATQWTKGCGTVTPGTTASTATSVCPTTSFTLSLTGAMTGPAITYQWQSAPTGSGSYTNIGSATSATYTGTQSVATDYRCVVTCSGSASAASSVVSIAMNASNTCYCIPTSTTATSYYITGFSTTGATTNITNTGTSSGQYNDYYATMSASATQGTTVNFSWTGNSTTSQKRSMYIDWNQDGDFDDAGEQVYNGTAVTSTTITGSFVVPYSSTPGNTRLRIRSMANSATMAPCGLATNGETEDYAFVVNAASGCIVPVSLAATVTTSTASVSFAAPPVGNTPTNYIYELRTDGTAAGSGATGLAQSGTVTASPVALSNLAQGISYVLYMRTFCSVGDTSAWTSLAMTIATDTFTPVSLGGFNADIIANGIGAATGSTTNDADGAGYAYVAADFKATPTSASPALGLPANRIITNGLRRYKLANYSGNNALRLPTTSTKGVLRFLAPKKANKVYVMGALGSGGSGCLDTTTIYFHDGTTQVAIPFYPDWGSGSGNTVITSALSRVKISDNTLGSSVLYMHDSAIVIATANRNKQIDSIGFSRGTGGASTVMNVMAVSIVPNTNQACKLPLAIDSVYNITNNSASVAWRGNGTNTNYQLSVVPQGGYADAGTITDVTGSAATVSPLSALNSATGLQVYVRTNCGSGSYSDWIGPIDFTTLSSDCSGTPAAGALTATATSVCTNTPYSLSVANVSSNNGITLKWQSSPTGTNTWTTLSTVTPAIGVSTYNYSVSTQTAGTDYRCVIACSFSNDSSVSNVVTVAQNPATTCYCTNTYTSNSGYITNFTTTGGITNLNNNSTVVSGGYSDYTAMQVAAVAGTSVSFSSTATSTNYMSIFVDWNQDGDFTDAGETVYSQNSSYASSFSGTIAVPPTATPGPTRMRVRLSWSAVITDACAAIANGETEDYTFNAIAQAACAGVPAPGNTNAAVASFCVSGSTTLTVDNNYITSSGITYQWQSSTDAGTTWSDVSGATTFTYTTPTLTQTRVYRLRMICSAGPDTAYSTAKTLVVNALPAVTVSPVQAAFCASGTATLTANGASTYAWSPATGLSATTGTSVDASPAALTTYTVTGTDGNGCSNSATTVVGPITNIKPVATSIDVCAVNTAASVTVAPIAATGSVEYELTDTTGAVIATWQSSNIFSVTPTTAGLQKYFVFARIASCTASVSDTGRVQLYAGFGATVVVNDAGCANGDGSIVVSNPNGPGQDNILTWYANDFTSTTLSATQATLSGNASITSGRAVITPSATSNKGGLTILNPSLITTNALNVSFDMTADQVINTYGTGGADGIAYSFGDDATYGSSITDGAGSKLRVVFDAADNGSENSNHAGIYVTYGYSANTQMGDASTGVLAHSTNTAWKVTTDKPVSIVITDAGKLTLTWNNTVIFSDVQLPPAYLAANKSNWKHLFTAFTGGDAMRFAIDNLNIKYGTETFSYGSSVAHSGSVPATWQSGNTFSGLNSGDSLDIWIANPSNPSSCNKKLGTYGVSGPVVTALLGQADPSCIGFEDGYVMLKVPVSGTYSVSYNRNGGSTVTQTGLVSADDGTNEFVLPFLSQGIYTNFKVINSTSCVSNTIAGPVTLTAPVATAIAAATTAGTPTAQPGAGTQYYTDGSCNLVAAITSPNNLGQVTASLTVGSVVTSTSGEPFLGRFYEITPSQNSTLGATLRLYFSDADFAAYNASASVGTSTYPAIATDGSNLRVRAFHGLASSGTSGPNGQYDAANADVLQPTAITHNTAGGFWVVDVYSPNGFSGFFANTTISAPLGIKLDKLSAHNEGAVNVVDWNTKGESAGDRFVIERSADGRSFAAIGTQAAKGVASGYAFVDNKPYNGVNYYRLIMENEDGTKDYSTVVTAAVKETAAFRFSVYPNPASSTVNVTVSDVTGTGHVELMDVTGRVIVSKEMTAGIPVVLSLDGLSQGMYVVKYHDGSRTESVKVNKSK